MQNLNKTVKVPPHLLCPIKRAKLHPLQFIRLVHLYLYKAGRNPIQYYISKTNPNKWGKKRFLVHRTLKHSSALQGKSLCKTQYKQCKLLQTKSLQFILAFFTTSGQGVKGSLIFTKLQGGGWLTNGTNRYCQIANYINTIQV
jgi:hypothetical protein